MIEVKAPDDYSSVRAKKSVFLAGSIEMGKAEDWQQRIASALQHVDVLVLNPRRAQWDASWEQSIDNPPFRQQVEWELDALDAAGLVIMYFAPETKSPITLLELGVHAAANPEKLVVCCPEGFWRKGNVDIVCNRYGVRQVETIDALIKHTVHYVQGVAA
ncbi:MAG: nucleoside 2-deoxyribosyltransferase domain-containing protein [Micavibrio sp.]|nr:nucleoside 2-deoxyribosyltransferase domain-containing protein [Micavibrio sp.]